MSNHVKNIIRFETGPNWIAEVISMIQDGEQGLGTIDFNKLIPMPASLDINEGSLTY